MKVIDLLNKIANDEKVPKEIKVNDKIYYYDETDCNEFYRYRTMSNELLTDYVDLNDEVEIIEDTPKVQVEMTQKEYNEYLDNKLDTPKEDKKIEPIKDEVWKLNNSIIKNKINEIIDKINGE